MAARMAARWRTVRYVSCATARVPACARSVDPERVGPRADVRRNAVLRVDEPTSGARVSIRLLEQEQQIVTSRTLGLFLGLRLCLLTLL